ncbi:3-methyladenine DNA glycosylase [Williamsia deligens]|uniref:3-methyladenine DNA glycosylase n=1 Tax=Williamsia deligens TaxID=321325 RepID=A0ABW3GAD6_9NOCA|nr:3-methyladenine DNA glycosylase [Williamsia deligens]MCP2196077.1 hypothetical protein [Williamsia deligens]
MTTAPTAVVARTMGVDEWSAAQTAHAARVDALLDDHPRRLPDGTEHPVWGFLFRYYNHRPARLRRWHPGHGVALSGRPPHVDRPHYLLDGDAIVVDPDHLEARRPTVEYVAALLRATAGRSARLNCFGLHEWAMVYREPDGRRHGTPLRLTPAQTDAVVEERGLRCTHFDAFRFFTGGAADRNAQPLSRARQVATEQPGCMHAGMDLYKWAAKLEVLVGSAVVIDALDLAFALRELDMRASPYDLGDLGFAAIAVETARGRAEYVARQRELAERASGIRAALLDRCDSLLLTATVGSSFPTAE